MIPVQPGDGDVIAEAEILLGDAAKNGLANADLPRLDLRQEELGQEPHDQKQERYDVEYSEQHG